MRTTPRNLAHWLEILCEDKRAIFAAAAHAQRAVDFLHVASSREELVVDLAIDASENPAP